MTKYCCHLLLLLLVVVRATAQDKPSMFFADSSRLGRPLAKDPKIVFFKNMYWMYYSIPANNQSGWGMGNATSHNLTNWQKVAD